MLIGRERKLPSATWRAAVHEAGHVVAYWYYTSTQRLEVTLEPDPRWPGSGGRVSTWTVRGLPAHDWCECACVFAGIAAELMLLDTANTGPTTYDLLRIAELLPNIAGSPPPRTWARGSTPPRVESERRPSAVASDIARAFGKSLPYDEEVAFYTAYRQARNLVHTHRERLLEVARLLDEKRTLTEDDIRPVLGPRLIARAPRFTPHGEPPPGDAPRASR